MTPFNIFSSDYCEKAYNTRYDKKNIVFDVDSLANAVTTDYVAAEYVNNIRSNDNFVASNVVILDCDNDFTEDSNQWFSPENIRDNLPNVRFAVHYSRNSGKVKNGKAARLKFHVLFPIEKINSKEEYIELKRRIMEILPIFDNKALDAAHFFFGTKDPKVEWFNGDITIDKYIAQEAQASDTILEGSRNSHMSSFAAKVLIRYGDNDNTAYDLFITEAEKCSPPLESKELENIWRSACKFYKKVSESPDYISPEAFNRSTYKPYDFTDVGQARALERCFSLKLRYTPSTDYLVYDGKIWVESKEKAQEVAQIQTDMQLKEAKNMISKASEALEKTGALAFLNDNGKFKKSDKMTPEQEKAITDYENAVSYRHFVLDRRSSKNIAATLKEARPSFLIKPEELDANPYLLCTPDGVYDLNKGINGRMDNKPEMFITKITAVSPSDKGKDIWDEFLDTVFCGDKALVDYVQNICGLVALGVVFFEALIIAYGDGRNCKSTFWNTIAKVLGSYSGNISADTLTVGCTRNVKPELAEIRGKRMLIASEMQEGARLNDATVKQLCSTDEIFAEKKYKDPFKFTPSHALILYTNHLPRVSAQDDGIWRRLVVIPFKAKIEGNSDIKNYSNYLFKNAGEAVLAWVIEGAKRVIESNYKFSTPDSVKQAINEYRSQNNWFGHFLEDKCEVGSEYKVSSSRLYSEYRNYSTENNEYCRSTTDFYTALENAGFKRMKIHNKRFISGLQIRNELCDDELFN